MKRLEAVVVSVNYADYLAETLPTVLPHVDDLVVVTIPEDGRTRGVCHRLGVRCLPTHAFYQWGDEFNKARGINYGLANLRCDDWVVHLDADIALPPRTRWMLGIVGLDARKIYGIDRVNVVGREAWDAHKAGAPAQWVSSCRVETSPEHRPGARLVHPGFQGYLPIGFAQFWHPKGSGVSRYPETADGSAEHTDVLHSAQWARRDRELLPEVVAYHLATRGNGGVPMGANWRGRKTPEFTREEGPYNCDAPAARESRTY